MGYKFSRLSMRVLEQAHKDLQLIFEEAIKYSPVDFGLSVSYRSPEEQFELYKKGRTETDDGWLVTNPKAVVTYKDGKEKLSQHNKYPAEAIDFYVYIPNKPHLSWDKTHMSAIIGCILSTANRLYEEGKIKYKAKSGADWNMNGEFLTDQSFDDMPHIELIT